MSPRLREKLLYLHAGDPQNLPYLYIILTHAHHEALLDTLKAKGLTGQILTQFVLERCSGEPIKLLKWLISETLKTNSPKTPKMGSDGFFQ